MKPILYGLLAAYLIGAPVAFADETADDFEELLRRIDPDAGGANPPPAPALSPKTDDRAPPLPAPAPASVPTMIECQGEIAARGQFISLPGTGFRFKSELDIGAGTHRVTHVSEGYLVRQGRSYPAGGDSSAAMLGVEANQLYWRIKLVRLDLRSGTLTGEGDVVLPRESRFLKPRAIVEGRCVISNQEDRT